MTLALHGKSRRRRSWLLFAALIAIVFGVSGSLMLSREDTKADSTTINFEAPAYSVGDIHGQNGWQKTGPSYDAEVVTTGGGQALRVSNGYASGSFGDQTFSPSLANEAGENWALNAGLSGGVRQTSFAVQYDLASVVPGAQQPGLAVSLSPDRGDGARMSFIKMQDDPSGISLYFADYQAGAYPYACDATNKFITTPVATGLDRTISHTVRLEMDFVDGRGNDVVRVYVDGVFKHTGTSWEDYFRDCEKKAPPTVDSVIIMARGTSVPSVLGQGFLIDNLNITSSAPAPLASTTVVKAGDLFPAGDWMFYNDKTDNTVDGDGPEGPNNALGSFVVGPSGAPLGNGSAEISVTGPVRRRNLATYQFSGTPLADITELKFSSRSTQAAEPPFIVMNIDFFLTDAWQQRLTFIPSITPNTWQEHDAIAGGAAMWTYSGTNWPAPNAQPGGTPKSWTQILTDYPNIRIRVSDAHVGIRVGHPTAAGDTANIDKFVFATAAHKATFDFEPSTCAAYCYVRTTGNDGSSPALAKLTIQAGINAVDAGGTVDVGPGTYAEDVNVTKSGITLQGAGIDQSIIEGPIGGSGAYPSTTLSIVGQSNVTVRGFTVTRAGNNPGDWNLGTLNSNGISIGTGGGGHVIEHNKVSGNRNGILIEATTGVEIRENIIDDNRTGVHLVNVNTGTNIHNNFITNNWTMGVLFRTDPPVSTPNTSSGILLNNNNISGNWASQIEARGVFTNGINAENNWLGTLAPTWLNAPDSNEQAYSLQAPPRTPPSGAPTAATIVYYDVANPLDYTPWLCSGTDTSLAIGFQPLFDCGDIEVTSTTANVGDTNVQVQVRANSVENLWGVQTYLTYDSSRLTLGGVQLGGGLDPDFVAVNSTSPGLISFAFSQTSGLPVTGTNVVIATLTFTATNTGAAVIGYQSGQTQLFSNNLGQPMGPLTKTDGTVTIGPAIPTTGDVNGTILLQGRVNNNSGATAEIDPPAHTPPAPPIAGSPTDTTDALGAFSVIASPTGSHTIRARMLGYLLATKSITVNAGANAAGTVTLVGGDADMSGTINVLDLSLIAGYFGQIAPFAPAPLANTTPDINGDNVVNILDLSLTAANYGQVGPTVWP